MYQLPLTNLEKVRKARKAVKNVLSEIGLEDCKNLLKELDGENVEKDTEEDSEEEDPLLGTEWTDFTDGYNGRLRKKWPYRSRTLCCVMCKYSSKNIYHYRNHVARCHEYLQRLCTLASCQRCVFVAPPRVVKKHILLFHGGRATDPVTSAGAATPAQPAVAQQVIERYKCRKCSYPSHSVFAVKKHIILKHLEGVAERYIGYRHPIAGSNAKLYCCKLCTVNTGNLDQMLHHLLVDPKHYSISTQVQAMIYDNKAGPAAAPRAISAANSNGLYVTLPSLAPKPVNKSLVPPSNGQPSGRTVVALQQLQGASNSATLICAPGSNQTFLPPQASALVQLASAEAKGLLQPSATISLRGSSVVQYPAVKPPPVASPQTQQVLIPAPKPAAVQIPPATQVTLQGTMLTSQSLLSHLIPTGNRVNGMPTYTFAPLQVAVPITQSSAKPTEQTATQAKKWITCPLCNELFPSNVFDMHIEVAHQNKLAAARTESLAGRAAFLRKMPDKTIKCLTCKVLLSEKSVLQHLLHGLSCLYCATLFFSVKQLAEHVKKHDPSSKLYCDFLRQNYKIYSKATSGILIPYFDVTTEAPQEILGECEVDLALVTSSLELIYVKLLPSTHSQVSPAPVKVNASCCPFCDEKFQEEAMYLQHLKQKHLVAPTIHAILKTDAFKCIYCNGVYTGKVTQQAVMLHIQRCRCSPKPPRAPKITAPPPPPLAKPAQAPRQPSGLFFLQVPQGVTVKPLQPKPPPPPPPPSQNKEQLESTKRLEAALKQVIELNKREREQKAAVRRKEPLEPEIVADSKVKLALEPMPPDRRGHEERRDFIARYFNARPYITRVEVEELCRRLSLSKSELVALFSAKRVRCMKSFNGSTAAVLLGFDMTQLARLRHPLEIPEQRVVESRETQLDELPEVLADAREAPLEPEPGPMDESGNDKTAAEVPMQQND
ncbi:activity-dependent neuroprotector homeobox protein 2b isoform X1 [Syngnathus acus]|uniref:activity-dependent neuroprotector homeobox protein 2b isoform X1 n=1 Tax=Syngnathus acus TaxID=161584 RepID=UPI0018863D32|nr:activity-dependent neuroprotector homeobox protein 2b isoform X1 [Syngnathus acus]XP_037119698.1 activity-dependent neuroprotector homeobox protein 2b isoform X1 [Syngnathus acus]